MFVHTSPLKCINSREATLTEFLSAPRRLDGSEVLDKATPFGDKSNGWIESLKYEGGCSNCAIYAFTTHESQEWIHTHSVLRFQDHLIEIFEDGRIRGLRWIDHDHPCEGRIHFRIILIFDRLLTKLNRQEITAKIIKALYNGRLAIEPIVVPRTFNLDIPIMSTGSILVPTVGIESWKALLAKPEKHWRNGYSAKSLAKSWEAAKSRKDGFPKAVHEVIETAAFATQGIVLLLGLPERITAMPGTGYGSHTDLFCLARNGIGELVSITVEGKVREPFGETVGTWLKSGTGTGSAANRKHRLSEICRQLGISTTGLDQLRYQLFHRMAAAIFEALQFNCQHAVLLVHSFDTSAEPTGFEDYAAFVKTLCASAKPAPGEVVELDVEVKGLRVWAGWVADRPAKS